MDRKLNYVDVLRGIAIIAVIIVHCGFAANTGFLPKTAINIISQGARGVQLFFLASAFTIFLSFSRRLHKEQHPRFYFFIRRFLRIAPMYYIGIIYYQWQYAARGSVSNIIANVLLIHGLWPSWMVACVPGGWTVGVEILFYCLVPILFKVVKTASGSVNLVLISLTIRFILLLLLKNHPLIYDKQLWSSFLFYYLPNQLPVFSLGILMFHMSKNEGEVVLNKKMVLSAIIICFTQLLATPNVIIPNEFVFGVAFLLLALTLRKYPTKILINNVFIKIGRASYSMYLIHFAIIFWLNKLGLTNLFHVVDRNTSYLNFISFFLIVTSLTFFVASITYRLIELPMIRLGSRLIAKIDRKSNP